MSREAMVDFMTAIEGQPAVPDRLAGELKGMDADERAGTFAACARSMGFLVTPEDVIAVSAEQAEGVVDASALETVAGGQSVGEFFEKFFRLFPSMAG